MLGLWLLYNGLDALFTDEGGGRGGGGCCPDAPGPAGFGRNVDIGGSEEASIGGSPLAGIPVWL